MILIMDLEKSQLRVYVRKLSHGIPKKVLMCSMKDAMLEFIQNTALEIAKKSKNKFSAEKKTKPQSASVSRTFSGIPRGKTSAFTDFKM